MLDEGESLVDLVANRSAFEDFDPDAVGEHGFGFVGLNPLALEHLVGAR
jgi:xylose isomerase